MIAFTRPHISLQLPTCDEIGLMRRLHDLIATKLQHKPGNALFKTKGYFSLINFSCVQVWDQKIRQRVNPKGESALSSWKLFL